MGSMSNKETFYFSHDYEPIGDHKIGAMLCDYGAAGYGYFWRITEMLHSEPSHKLQLKSIVYKAIAKQMQANAEQLLKFVKDCIEEYELFATDGTHFWSERVNRNMDKREEISQKRSEAGKRGAFIKQNQANAKQTLAIVKQNAAKERKGNIKEIEIPNGATPNGSPHPNQTSN